MRNLLVCGAPLAFATLARREPRWRRLLDTTLIADATRQLLVLVLGLATYPREFGLHVAPYLPIEFAAFGGAGAVYLAARRGERPNHKTIAPVLAAIVLVAAMVEVLTAGRIQPSSTR